MSEPIFQRVAGTQFYWLPSSSRTFGFLASPETALGETPPLSATWADVGGAYVLLGEAPSDDNSFVVALRQYLPLLGGSIPRIAWIQNPNDAPMQWRGTPLFAELESSSAATWRTKARTDFSFGSYTLSLAGGAELGLATEQQGWGFALRKDAAPATLLAPGGIFASCDSVAVLTLSAAATGVWRFNIEALTVSGEPSGLQKLETGIRYFATSAADPNFVTAIRLDALLQPDGMPLTLGCSFDPLRLLDVSRTHLDFLPNANNVLPQLGSAFATARGYAIDLTAEQAGLAFCVQPLEPGEPGAAVHVDYYLAPHGSYRLSVILPQECAQVEDSTDQLMLGASGLEYLALSPSGTHRMYFYAGKPAYAASHAENKPALNTLGTTAWIYVEEQGNSLNYYAQPENATLFTAGSSAYLDYFEVPAATLPPADGIRSFPAAPYRNLDPALIPEALELERSAIAPTRRKQIIALVNGVAPRTEVANGNEKIAVTPQGMAVGIGDDGAWDWVGIGNDSNSTLPNLRFTDVGPKLRAALQTNELFLVLGDPDAFLADSSVGYQLTADSLQTIASLPEEQGVPPAVLAAVSRAFQSAGYPVYPNEALFDAALLQASPAMPVEQRRVFQRFAGMLTATIESWKFQLAPRNWIAPDSTRKALLLMKYATGRSIREYVQDTASWAWPEVAASGGSPGVARQQILDVITQAEKDSENNNAYMRFLRIIDDRSWNGLLALSCDVPISSLPPALQMLSAGISASQFAAHHLGISATPFHTTPALAFEHSSLFGLIDYRDPDTPYFEENVDYLFHVSRLSISFLNSAIVGFESTVQLLLNRLFGVKPILYPTNMGNSMELSGVYQRQRAASGEETGTYLFTLDTPAWFSLQQSALQTVDFTAAQLVMSSRKDGVVSAKFQLAGQLRFYRPERFDPFCWGPVAVNADNFPDDPSLDGYLTFSNYVIFISFSNGDPSGTLKWSVNEGALAFDTINSKVRPDALAALFPIRLAGLVAAQPAIGEKAEQTPSSLGYISVSAPIEQSTLTAPWYGLVYDLDLGDLGALANAAGIYVRVLAAWSAGGSAQLPAIYLGVQLPGLHDALGVNLPLQGILNLGFRTIQFSADEDDGRRSYALRLRDFALRLLGKTFPPGHNDIYIVGDPAGPSKSAQLGWYAAYASEKDNKKKRRADRHALLAARNSTEVH
jgi:hypothetical protein